MDIFTHVFLGAAVGGMIASKKIGNKALLWGGLLSVVPDLDMLVYPFIEPTRAALFHRGFSHSIFFFLLIAPFLAMGIQKLQKQVPYTRAQWTRFVFLILLAHSVLDVFTSYGTGILEPFSDKRFALSSIAIIDVFFSVPLIVLVVLAFLAKEWRFKTMYTWLAVFISVLYLSFTFLNKLYIQASFETLLAKEEIRYQKTEIFPTIGTNFTWNCIAQDRDGFWMKTMSNVPRLESDMFLYLRNDYYMFDFISDARISNLQRFSKGYYSAMKRSDGTVDFRDLRFGKIGNTHDSPFVFTYKIHHAQGEIQNIERIRPSFREVTLFK